MPGTATLQSGGQKAKRWIVTFSADGDTTFTFDHGLGGAPDHITICPLNALAYVGQVSRGVISATQITINKAAAVGSAGASVEVIAFLPHSSF